MNADKIKYHLIHIIIIIKKGWLHERVILLIDI